MLPKLLLILLAIGLFEPVLLAQDKCTLTVKSLPAVRKLRLGMTLSQIRAIYPTMRTEKLGYMETWFEPAIKNPDPDVRGIGLTIENNKLVSFDISYQPTIQWASGEEFAYQFMTNLGVPHPKKELASFTSSDDKEGFHGYCKDFYLYFTANKNFIWFKVEANNIWDEIRKGEKNKKQTFKP